MPALEKPPASSFGRGSDADDVGDIDALNGGRLSFAVHRRSKHVRRADGTFDLTGSMNWVGAFSLGLVGATGVFPFAGYALRNLGGVTLVVVVVATAVAVFLCATLCELTTAFPRRKGGMPALIFITWSPLVGPKAAGFLGGLCTWAYWIGYFPASPAHCYLCALYIVDIIGIARGASTGPLFAGFGTAWHSNVMVVACIIFAGVLLITYLGMKLGARFAKITGAFSVASLVVIIGLPLFRLGSVDVASIDLFKLPSLAETGSGADQPWEIVLAWSYWTSFFVFGIEASASYVGDCHDPVKDGARAILLSSLFGLAVFTMVPFLLLAVLGAENIAATTGNPSEVFGLYAVTVFRTKQGGVLHALVLCALLANSALAALGNLNGSIIALRQASLDGALPRSFGATNSYGAPVGGIAATGVLCIVLLLSGSPVQIYNFAQMGYLLCIAMSFFGYAIFRHYKDDIQRPIVLPKWCGYLSFLMGMLCTGLWGVGGYQAAVAEKGWWPLAGGAVVLASFMPLYRARIYDDRTAIKGADGRIIVSGEVRRDVFDFSGPEAIKRQTNPMGNHNKEGL